MNLLTLLGAIFWDRILGEPPVRFHPTVWMGSYIKYLWQLKRSHTPTGDFIWGIFLLLSGLILFITPLCYFIFIIGNWSVVLKILISIPLLKVSFSVRFLLQAAGEIQEALEQKDIEKARRLTAYHLVSRETSHLDEEEIVSCVIESVAENITDSFISPLFYFLLFGIPGAWGFRLVNTGDAMIAYRNEEFEWGGKFTAWTDSILNWIPARLTAFGIVAASCLTPGYSGGDSWRAMKTGRLATASPNAGWTMGAMAGTLNIRLEKKGEYILNGGADPLTVQKIESCRKMTILSLILTMTIVIALIQGGIWVLSTVV